MVLLSNDAMLYSFFMSKFKKIIDQLTEEIYMMVRESIENKVYRPHIPKWYPRQRDFGGLLGAWEKLTKRTAMNVIEGSVKYDPENIFSIPSNFIHGSYYWTHSDIREELVDIIVQGKSGKLFGDGWWRRPRDFWSPVYKKIEGTWVDRRFQQLMRQEGIQYRKTG